ncbi:MAG: hypothetical protein J6T59_07190 [Bacteroidales bacterium]|nr:hypothetical protein [Bacteroidales bacterium]
MKQHRTLIILLALLLLHLTGFGQVDITAEDSIPPIPLVTDTVLTIDSSNVIISDTDIVEYSGVEDPFIRYDLNHLEWGRDSMNLVHFFDRLREVMETKQGNIHIVHLGASHVQAGTFTHRLRTNLLDEYGGPPAERGFIFPYYAAASCNNPNDYKISKRANFNLIRNVYQNYTFPLGGSGIAVWCSDTANSITVKMNAPGYDFYADTIILLGATHGWPIDPILQYDTIYHFPDSEDLAHDRYFYYPIKPVRDFTIHFPCSARDTFVVEGILLRNGRSGITVSSIGVNGAQVTSYLRCKNFVRDWELIKPDLVIFGIGVNDAYGSTFDSLAFKNNYLKLVARIREVNPDCAFIFMSNNDTWKKGKKGKYYVNPTGPAVSDVMHRLANLTGGAVWDQFNIMGGLRSMNTWRKKGLAQKDYVHFTAAGYQQLGDLLFEAIINEIRRP